MCDDSRLFSMLSFIKHIVLDATYYVMASDTRAWISFAHHLSIKLCVRPLPKFGEEKMLANNEHIFKMQVHNLHQQHTAQTLDFP